ncbi:MAG TPA: presqualene diphosphate synthase HpnD [Gaiellaceae bacterium]|nr:presqualene diphosphate synthase HpnD [Gaiellaceae bacterium]
MQPTDAYRVCADVARASGTSFYRGMRLLPKPKRDALFAIYAFARRVDDIADDAGDGAQLAAMRAWRSELDDPVYAALDDACTRFPIPVDALDDLIDGAEMDLRGTRYSTFAELEVYCRRVAGSIGRLAVGVFGSQEFELADRLGVAFQLTNILRDVAEDHANGRVYLPQEDLDRFGVDLGAPAAGFADLVRFEAARAEQWYDDGLQLLTHLDRSSASSVAAMASAYRRLLRRIDRNPDAVLTRRVSLPTWEKGWVAARSLVGV